MKWLKKLENCNISFHIHVLDKEDFIVIRKGNTEKRIVYILDGLMQLIKVFSNGEKICIELLHSCQTAITPKPASRTSNYCSILTAITFTKIITVSEQEINKIPAAGTLSEIAQDMILQKNKNYQIASILSHRNTKKRIIQLIIILAKQFGQIKGQIVTIPFHLSHQTIADITGSQRGTVNKIMNQLRKNSSIRYSSKNMIICSLTRLIQD